MCTTEMAEHTMALLLGAARKIVLMHKKTESGAWGVKRRETIWRISGKTLGLIGFGNSAKAVAKRAKAFGLKILSYHRHVDSDVEKIYSVEPVSFEKLLKESDFISLHIPLTPETRGLISEKELKMMKRTAILINTARGAIVDEMALARGLKEGWIAGAGIDVYEHINVFREPEEIPPKSPYFKLDNIIYTPHIGSWSEEATKENSGKDGAVEARRVLQGYWPRNCVNPEVKPWFKMKE